jgi:hypothetical protein
MATDGADVTGDWLYKSSAFQTRLPMPTAGSSFLDVDAFKSLLPGHSRLYSKSQSIGNLLDSAMTGERSSRTDLSTFRVGGVGRL